VSPLVISLIAFCCIFVGTLLGMSLRQVLPQHHLSDESKDVMKLGTAMIATLAALVIGLLIASAKSNFDALNNGLIESASKVMLLDRAMADYGSETREARDLLRRNLASVIERLWSKETKGQTELMASPPRTGIGTIEDKLRQLSPQNDAQRWLQSRALQLSSDIQDTRWLLFTRYSQSSYPAAFLVILVSWLVIIFFSFGLFSPRNVTVIIVLFVCALSASGSLYLIEELDRPYGGLISVSSASLRTALANLGQ